MGCILQAKLYMRTFAEANAEATQMEAYIHDDAFPPTVCRMENPVVHGPFACGCKRDLEGRAGGGWDYWMGDWIQHPSPLSVLLKPKLCQ